MEHSIKHVLANEILKHVPEMPLEMGVSFNRDNATILLTKYATLTEPQQQAVMGLLVNLYVYSMYKQEQFLDPYLYADIPEYPIEKSKEHRDFAIGYLQIGGLIEVKNGKIHIVAPDELRTFGGMVIALTFGEKLFQKQTVDSEKFPRRLIARPVGLCINLIEIDNGKETKIHKIQSTGAVRAFFDECWKLAGTCISFEQLRDVIPLTEHQKFKPSDYLKTLKLQQGDRLNRYAYVDQSEGYVYFQKHYNPEPFTKSVLNQYQKQQS